MELPQRLADSHLVFRHPSWVPLALAVVGVIVLLLAVSQAIVSALGGTATLETLIDLFFVGVPGLFLFYTGLWLPQSDITPRHYPRIFTWVLGGVFVMYLFILLRDGHPGVSVDWTVGTQAIALTIGSIGGLLIGVQETRATVRAEQLESYTAELEEREQQLQRQNDQLERFAGVLSHDLRNPLNVATGRLELAQQECDSEHLDSIADAHARIEALISDLLTLARQGNSINEVEPVDISSLSQQCWRNVATANATFVSADVHPVVADRDRLQQLLENLFRNAVEHGGDRVTVGELDDASGFFVADDGPGIPEAERADVFESGYSTNESGTGFGLAIVAEIANAHDWDVRVTESAEGGARFEVTGLEFAS